MDTFVLALGAVGLIFLIPIVLYVYSYLVCTSKWYKRIIDEREVAIQNVENAVSELKEILRDNNPPGDLVDIIPEHTGRIKPNCCEVKVVKGNTYEPKTENEENETGAGVV